MNKYLNIDYAVALYYLVQTFELGLRLQVSHWLHLFLLLDFGDVFFMARTHFY